MKNKTELSSTDVCVRMSKAGLEGVGLGVVGDKSPPSPHSPPPSPPRGAPTPPSQTKIKCESPVPLLSSNIPSPRPIGSPPSSGAGAEVKGKPGTPIPSGSVKGATPRPPSASGEDTSSPKHASAPTSGNAGGRLTFFREGKFLLELSHRTDMGAPAGWVPVKSKTYWPPPSSTTTTTTQHPLRHDTPTSHSVSDDCSSLNSSPWTGEHVRKQSMPRRDKSSVLQTFSFHWYAVPLTRDVRKKIKLRRNPFNYITGPVGPWKPTESKEVPRKTVKSECVDNSQQNKRNRLEAKVQVLGEKYGWRVDSKVPLQSLFEKRTIVAETVDPTFVSPRKRYLRQMESDQELFHRKKLHSGVSAAHIPGERPSSSSSPSHHHTNRSAINSHPSSVYSIDSILNNESASKKSESFLRTLLKPETSVPQSKPSVVKEHVNDTLTHTVKAVKQERTERVHADRSEQHSSSHRDRKDNVADLSRIPADRYDLSRYGPVNNFASIYGFNPYLDPRYLMLQSLAAPGLQSLAQGLVPTLSSQQADLSQAVAAAAAAAVAPYPLGRLHPNLAGSQYLSGGLSPGHTPPTSVPAQIARPQAHSARSSPHHMLHSPSPKPPAAPSTPASPHLSRGASPRGAASPWHQPPPAHPHSPQKPIMSPSPHPSPPPQDAPLNLSKPRNHLGK